MMLDNFGVIEGSWRDALSPGPPVPGYPPVPTGIRCLRATPVRRQRGRHTGRRPDRHPFEPGPPSPPPTSARVYGLTYLDGTTPDSWAQHGQPEPPVTCPAEGTPYRNAPGQDGCRARVVP